MVSLVHFLSLVSRLEISFCILSHYLALIGRWFVFCRKLSFWHPLVIPEIRLSTWPPSFFNYECCVRPSFWSSRWQPDGCGKTVERLQTPASSWVVLLDRWYNPRHHNQRYRAGMAAAPNPSSPKCYSMADWLLVSKSVSECRNRCVSQFYSDYPQAWPSTSVHPRMAWIGQPWKLMAPVVTDVGQDWPTSATDGAAYLAHGREFCENF